MSQAPLRIILAGLLLGATGLFWTTLVAIAPWSVGWRDSGEFILTSFFLDIPHPAGFPTYSMLANAVSLITFGPIAWRTHIFSALCAVGVLVATYRLTIELSRSLGLETSQARIAGVLSATLVSSTVPFARSVSTAEVYGLHALFILVILELTSRFSRTADSRYWYSAAFLGGLALGNHVVSVLPGAVLLLTYALSRRLALRHVTFGAFFVTLGAAVYLYLPMRAAQHPPLNTGAPATVERFLRHTTDARDRALRPVNNSAAKQVPPPVAQAPAIKDLTRLAKIIGAFAFVVGVTGLFFGLVRSPALYAPLLGVALTTLLFFANWDPDPWLAAIAVLSVGAGVAVSAALRSSKLAPVTRILIPMSCAVWIGLAAEGTLWRTGENAKHALFELPAKVVSDSMARIPRYALYITEPSWFIARYLQQVEGVRTDLHLAYLPSLLFPDFFAPVQATSRYEWFQATPDGPSNVPAMENVKRLVYLSSRFTLISMELVPTVVDTFKKVLILAPSAAVLLQRDVTGSLSPQFPILRGHQLRSLFLEAKDLPPSLASDTINYAEVKLLQELQSLVTMGYKEAACQLGTEACGGTEHDHCPAKLLVIIKGVCH